MAQQYKFEAANRTFGTRLAWLTAGCLLTTIPALAQDDRSGVSVPQPVTAVDSGDSMVSSPPPAKPSAAVPMPAPSSESSAPAVYGPYVPYRAPGTAATSAPTSPAKPFDPDASIVTEETARGRRPLTSAAGESAADPDAGIVTRIPTRPGEINDGTLIRVKLRETISTLTTKPGTHFSAEVSEPVMQEGRVYVPAGSVLEGRVTWVRSGKRVGNGAAIHLEPERVVLPDGTTYSLHAHAIDTSSWQNTKVDAEGTIVRRESIKGTLVAGGLVTGGAIAAGAVIGGVPGALIGAGVGAGVTAVVWFKQDRQAELPKDLGVIFSLTAPMTVTPAHAALPATPATEIPGGE